VTTRERPRRRSAGRAGRPAPEAEGAQVAPRPGAVLVAPGDEFGAALAEHVVVPVLEGFPLEVMRLEAALPAKEIGPALAAIMNAQVVVATVTGTSPEILLGIARRGRSGRRTILLAPALRGVQPAADVLRHPATPQGVREVEEALRRALHGLVCGDRAGAAAQAEAVRLDVLGAEEARKAALRRIEAGVVPVSDQADEALEALCRAYGVLGAWPEVVRLADVAGAAEDPSGLPASVVWVYAVALNRVGRDREAQEMLEARLRRDGPDVGLFAALGRIHKDRWGRTAAKRELDAAIRAYRKGFDVDGDYYPGVNALTLMAVGGRTAGRLTPRLDEVRGAHARGRHPHQPPRW
jgi:hypothetical protein